MRKRAILLGLVGAVGFAPLALAQSATTATVTIQCTTFPGQTIFGIEFAGTGFTPPAACTTGSSCVGCINALRNLTGAAGPAFFVSSVINVDAQSGYSGPYYLLTRF
jgi:hypothetical protein